MLCGSSQIPQEGEKESSFSTVKVSTGEFYSLSQARLKQLLEKVQCSEEDVRLRLTEGLVGGKSAKESGKEKMNSYCQMPAQQVIHEFYV